jgi:hypothetical protein
MIINAKYFHTISRQQHLGHDLIDYEDLKITLINNGNITVKFRFEVSSI